jgi:hypothetical protein
MCLFVASIRSYISWPESFGWCSYSDSTHPIQRAAIRSGHGSIGIQFVRASFLDPVDDEHWNHIVSTLGTRGFRYSYSNDVFAPGEPSAYSDLPRRWYAMGFGFGWERKVRRSVHFSENRKRLDKPRAMSTVWLCSVPYWFLIMLTVVPPGWHVWNRGRRRRLLRHGLCPRCGYDLRGLSGGRCPECGGEIPAPSVAQTG